MRHNCGVGERSGYLLDDRREFAGRAPFSARNGEPIR
jgi:hypothetical protein